MNSENVKDHFTYRITWSGEDGEYVGLCAEFPSLTWLAQTSEEAFSGIRRLVSDCISDMRAEGEIVPQSIPDRIIKREVSGAGADGNARGAGHARGGTGR